MKVYVLNVSRNVWREAERDALDLIERRKEETECQPWWTFDVGHDLFSGFSPLRLPDEKADNPAYCAAMQLILARSARAVRQSILRRVKAEIVLARAA
jgi:hypothetical protein